MAKHLVQTLKGALLDHAVALANGWQKVRDEFGDEAWRGPQAGDILGVSPASAYKPSSDWSQGGPIIEHELYEFTNDRGWREDGSFGRVWEAQSILTGYWEGDTMLIAGMRAYVAEKLGAEVELPDLPT